MPQLESSKCAHIVIFPAPNMDLKIIKEVPRLRRFSKVTHSRSPELIHSLEN
jgi:hypothetical protein